MPFSHRQLREVFHLLFLAQLLKISDPSLYVLKGGTNLRFFFRSPRYSEDMDIDVLAGSVSTLRKNGYKILDSAPFQRSLRSYGIVEVLPSDRDRAKHTATTQRFRLQLLTVAGEKLSTKIEFSRRKHEKAYIRESIDNTVVYPYRQLSFPCQHYPAAIAARQKVAALAHRTAVQARDVFDLYILHLGGHPLFAAGELEPETRNLALEQLLTLSFEDYSGQVLPFLQAEEAARYASRGCWKEMRDLVFHLLDAG